MEKSVLILRFLSSPCREQLARVLCNYYYYSCGTDGVLTVPRYICPDVCTYVSSVNCASEWQSLENVVYAHVSTDPFYTNDPTLFLPQCNETHLPIEFLNLSSDCCTDGGIEIPGKSNNLIIVIILILLPQSKLIFHSSNKFYCYIIFNQYHFPQHCFIWW